VVPAEESLLPEPHHEAEAIIKGIQAIATKCPEYGADGPVSGTTVQ
jgi:hypothetical protein